MEKKNNKFKRQAKMIAVTFPTDRRRTLCRTVVSHDIEREGEGRERARARAKAKARARSNHRTNMQSQSNIYQSGEVCCVYVCAVACERTEHKTYRKYEAYILYMYINILTVELLLSAEYIAIYNIIIYIYIYLYCLLCLSM